MEWAIIADDLTGALDAAAPFAAAGWRVAVATRPEALDAALRQGAQVVAVSTRSREIAPEAARRRVAAVLAALPAGLRLFKKVDSRLKGNLIAELDAFGDVPLFVAPAIPDFGRVVRAGCVMGFGVPVPIDVTAALGPHAARAIVPDTEAQEGIAAAVRHVPDGTVLVGARGLAQALAGDARRAPTAALTAPFLIAVGSTDPITVAQVAALRAARDDLTYLDAPAGRVSTMKMGALTLVQAVPGEVRPEAEVAADFAAGLARMASGAASMLVTGGATAEAVLDALGSDYLDILGEILPGLPVTRASGLTLVTKSGGFGGPETFVTLAEGALSPVATEK